MYSDTIAISDVLSKAESSCQSFGERVVSEQRERRRRLYPSVGPVKKAIRSSLVMNDCSNFERFLRMSRSVANV